MEQENKITLRQFYRDIDEKLLSQSHDEAINYLQFLLNKYPKNLAVYQLLAKAYLDFKQFDLALLLFEKILEIDPDDFVSHIGISIISESFGNLERALDRMRRAYEIQPSNESLQNEVIRLVRQKDGFAPEKLRLTRGALIKMYTRSKLAEQAIAEAKLGIHESPDRVDFKIHLADMLYESGKIEESIELSLQILKDYPYCKPVLQLLYKSFSSSQDSSQADLYKARLSELDPYFVFMKPETKNVNDIPDIAIMLEPNVFPEQGIGDIQKFLEKSWEITSVTTPQQIETNNSDWQSIVDDAIANNGIGEPINDTNVEEINTQSDSEPIDKQQTDPKPSKREMFLKRISNSISPIDEELYADDEIPDWVLSYGALENNIPDASPSEQVSEQDPAAFQDSEFEEDGMTDHATPVNPEISEKRFISESTEWRKLEDVPAEADDMFESDLDDTQRIKIVMKAPAEIFVQLETAFNENDTEFSIQCLETLISEEFNLDAVANMTQRYLENHPSEIELWLLLVRIYRKLDLSDKALSALQNAQLNISI